VLAQAGDSDAAVSRRCPPWAAWEASVLLSEG